MSSYPVATLFSEKISIGVSARRRYGSFVAIFLSRNNGKRHGLAFEYVQAQTLDLSDRHLGRSVNSPPSFAQRSSFTQRFSLVNFHARLLVKFVTAGNISRESLGNVEKNFSSDIHCSGGDRNNPFKSESKPRF